MPGWQETDFRLRLTPKQPIMWTVSRGLEKLPLADVPTNGFFNDGNIVPVARGSDGRGTEVRAGGR